MKRFVLLVLFCLNLGRAWADGTVDYGKIKHIILIYQENWSFDGLYGKFPGADGIDNAGAAVSQVDLKGNLLKTLPQPNIDKKVDGKKTRVMDDRFPKDMPVGPYDLSKYVPVTSITGDLVHRYYQEQAQIDGGKMDKFVAGSNNGGLVMSYFDATDLPEGKLASQYTLCDHYFHEAFGGSFLNHIFFVAMAPPPFPNAPEKIVAQVGPDGMPMLGKDGAVSPEGFAINTIQSVNHPHEKDTPEDELLPNLTMPTIGDKLSEKKVTWAWYAGGWDDALSGKSDENFAFHHQPFVYFKNYADGTKAKRIHLKDEKDLDAILDGKGKLPQVSFVKFISLDDEHPRDADVMRGQKHTAELVEKILGSKYGKDCAILITYDEHGGRWDHVGPPKVDQWGPGSRVPFIIISPFAKKGFVDHTLYTTASILKFIETRFGVEPLNDRDGKAANLDNAFDFSQTK